MNLLGEPGVGLPGGPGRRIPNPADVRAARGRVWGVLILLLILVLAQLVHWYQSRDVVTGAHGPFPAAFATGAPVAPERVIRRTPDDTTLVHGLSLQSTDSGVRAVNLRTGKEYWRYERGDVDSVGKLVEASERTVVIGYWDGRLDGVDLRTGKPLWHVEIPHGEGFRSVELAGGQAVTEAPGAVRAFGIRDGRSLWTVKTPESCPEVVVYTVYALPEHLSVIPVICNTSSPDRDEYNLLLGVDNRTGRVLWQQHTPDLQKTVRGDERTLAVSDPDTDGLPFVELLDMNRQGAVAHAYIHTDEWDPVASGDGTVVSATDPKSHSEDHDTLLRAYSTRHGRLAWQLRAPAGQEYGSPGIADGRVYVVRQPFLTEADAGRQVRADLLVLDAGTGRLLHTLRLPAVTVQDDYDYFVKLDVQDIAGGALSIGWRDSQGDLLIATD